jgi:hypothetical protein
LKVESLVIEFHTLIEGGLQAAFNPANIPTSSDVTDEDRRSVMSVTDHDRFSQSHLRFRRRNGLTA